MHETASEAAQQQAAIQSLKPNLLTRDQGPLYRQLGDRLRGQIGAGALLPGSSLPREADLATGFGVSLITVRQALNELVAEGLITRRRAKTSIVAVPQALLKPREMRSLGAMAEAADTTDRRLVINSFRKERSSRACEVFDLKPGTACHCLRVIQLTSGLPVSQIAFFFPPAIGGQLKRADFDDVVVFRVVQRQLGIQLSRAQITVRAESADDALAKVLQCESGAPVLATEMVFFTVAGDPVELTITRNRADRFSVTFDAPNNLL